MPDPRRPMVERGGRGKVWTRQESLFVFYDEDAVKGVRKSMAAWLRGISISQSAGEWLR